MLCYGPCCPGRRLAGPGPDNRPAGRSELAHMTAARAAWPRAARRS